MRWIQCFASQNSKLLTMSAGGELSGWAVHFTEAPLCFLENRPCWNLSPDTSDGWMDGLALTASGQPLLVSLSNWLWDFDLCCPTAAEVLPQRKAKVRTESSSFHILEERVSITCFICNLLALEKHGHSFLLSFTAGEKDHLHIIVKTKSLM